MSRADAIIRRTDSALRRVNVTERDVYKRVITRTGGDDLIGRPGSVTHVDTKIDPPPAYQRLGRNIVGNNVAAESVLSGSETRVADDYAVLISVTAMSEADFKNENVLIVFKDAAGGEEVFRITDYEPTLFQGQVLNFTAYIRSLKRPTQ